MVSKAKRLVTGSALGGFSFVLRIFISLFMTPLMILSFGDDMYGLWMLVASFSGFYGMLDLGLSTAVQRYMSRSLGQEDTDEVNVVFNTSLVIFSGISVIAILFAGSLAYLAPLFVKDIANVPIFRVVILLFSVNIVLGFPMRSFWGILASNLRYDVSVYLDLANILIKTPLIIIFLKLGYGVITIATVNLVTDLLWNAANMFYALKIAPYIKISYRYVRFKRLRKFFNYSIYVFISKIAAIVKFNIDNYVISAFVGLGAVAIYSIGMRLIRYAMDFSFKMVGLMTPVFSQYEGRGDFDSIREKFFFVFKAGIYVSMFFGSLLFFLAQPFILRWVGEGYNDSHFVVFILVVPAVFTMMMVPSNQLLYGTSNHKFLTWVNSFEAIANLVLSLIFVKFWGLKGVAMGTAIPMFIVKAIIQPIYTARIIGIKIHKLYILMIVTMSKSIFVLAILYFLTKNLIVASFPKLIAFGILQTLLFGFIIFKIGLSQDEQDQLYRVFIPSWAKKSFDWNH